MAIINCKECKKEVSNTAEKCPHCGAAVARKPIGCGTAIFLILLFLVFASVVGPMLSGDSRSSASAIATVPTKVVNPYCKTPKKNGTMDARACDLSELCKDWVFFRKKTLESNAKGDKAATYEAQKSFAAVNLSLSEYRDEDVHACIKANGG